VVNQKRNYGVMKAADLSVKPNLKLRAKRKADTTKPRPTRPNQWWGIDMTKVMIEGFGWVYLVVVLDWHSKKVVGHYAGLQARAWHWLVALNRAVNRQFPHAPRCRPSCGRAATARCRCRWWGCRARRCGNRSARCRSCP
jgi:putative transposase